MDTGCNSTKGLELNCDSMLASLERNLASGCGLGNMSSDILGPSNVDVAPAEGDNPLPRDDFDAVLRYLNQMLMEEGLDQRPCMYQDLLALQAAEKSFYDALRGKDHSSINTTLTVAVGESSGNQESKDLTSTVSSRQNRIFSSGNNPMGSSSIPDESNYESSQIQNSVANPQLALSDLQSCDNLSSFNQELRGLFDSPSSNPQVLDSSTVSRGQRVLNSRGEQSNITGIHYREDDVHVEERSSKQFASCAVEFDPIEMYDKVLLCPSGNPGIYTESQCPCDKKPDSEGRKSQQIVLPEEPKRGRPRAGERKPNIREVVDLRSLLTQCAQSVAIYDNRTAHELLNRIRQHSSPYGDATERLAHCFANALEARISGMGTTLYTAISTRRVSAAETLKAYQSYVLACPFTRMSNIFADKSIGRLTRGASTIHIIDFGVLYGFQWPCIIQGVSVRPEGPPKLRITGIDLPQPGFRPAERVEETGRRLKRCCKRFNVPFEYQAIARKWETISVEDLKIEKGETVVVNCLYRLRHVHDETAENSSPRDAVLNLIKTINPDYFIHGVLNGSYNAPFFITRFRDALYHFSSLFDMFDKTLPREDQDRFLFEKEVIGRDAMNVIACEGTERVERPETYKQWQVRNRRAGFTQLPLIQEIVKEVRAKVRLHYHKDFLVDEHSNWLLQGWKGRIIYAISCWKPAQQREKKRFG